MVISVAVISAVLWAALADVPEGAILGWFCFGCFAVFVVGDLVWKGRSVWKDQVFRYGTVFFLVANFFLFRRFLWDGRSIGGLEMAALYGIEGAVFGAFRRWREKAVGAEPDFSQQR